MDKLTAAQILGVAEYTIVGIEYDLPLDAWAVQVRDMASHEVVTRHIPAENVAPSAPAADEDEGSRGEALVETVEDLQVPDGNVQDVLDWAAGSVYKARAALAVELAKDRPRKGVTEPLGVLIEAAEDQGL